MKKIKQILISLCLALLIPLGLVLTGCGATPSNEVRGVFFDSDFYDEETGYAVFWLDHETPTKLKYKVNPSSWSGYIPEFQVIKSGINPDNYGRFKLESNGEVTIYDYAFEDIIIQISLNDFTDMCIVKLQKYPERIFFINENQDQVTENYTTIGSNSIYKLHIFGQYSGEDEPRELSENEYTFNVVSSDETIISVFNPKRLTVATVKTRAETATVSIQLLTANGEALNKEPLTFKFDVIPIISEARLVIDGYGRFITGEEEETIEITVHDITHKNDKDYYVLNYKAMLLSEAEIGSRQTLFDEEVVKFDIEVVSDKLGVSSEYGSRQIYIETGLLDTEIRLTFRFGLNTYDFKQYSVDFVIRLRSV